MRDETLMRYERHASLLLGFGDQTRLADATGSSQPEWSRKLNPADARRTFNLRDIVAFTNVVGPGLLEELAKDCGFELVPSLEQVEACIKRSLGSLVTSKARFNLELVEASSDGVICPVEAASLRDAVAQVRRVAGEVEAQLDRAARERLRWEV